MFKTLMQMLRKLDQFQALDIRLSASCTSASFSPYLTLIFAMSEHPTQQRHSKRWRVELEPSSIGISSCGKLPEMGNYIIAGCRYGGPLGTFLQYTYQRGRFRIVGCATSAFAKAQVQLYGRGHITPQCG